METVAESYRGLSFLIAASLDRLLVPVALIVALCGAAMIGIQLVEIFSSDPYAMHRL